MSSKLLRNFIVVSLQGGISHGAFFLNALKWVLNLLTESERDTTGAPIDSIYYVLGVNHKNKGG